MNTPHDYGEPWHIEEFSASIAISERPYEGERCIIVSDSGAKSDALRRAVQCVNACAGIPDPVAAIQAAREDAERLAHLVQITVGGLYYLANVAHDTGDVKRISAEARSSWHRINAQMKEALAAHEALTTTKHNKT